MTTEKLTGILLCGGKSLRMGTDKALLELKSMPMVTYPLKIMQQFCSEILISVNDRRLDFLGYPTIRDQIQDIGPMGGLQACLKYSTNNLNLVLACDMPLINGLLMKKMIWVAEQYDAVVPMLNHRPEPLYALYKKNILEAVEQSIGQKVYSLQKLLSKLNVCYIETEDDQINELVNVNTPSEIENYERLSKLS